MDWEGKIRQLGLIAIRAVVVDVQKMQRFKNLTENSLNLFD